MVGWQFVNVMFIVIVGAGIASRTLHAEPSDAKHLAFPGWEDVRLASPPPKDAKQVCKPLTDSGGMTVCGGCRSAALPLPCISVTVTKQGNVSSVSATVSTILPKEDDNEDTRTIAAISAKWGRPTSVKHMPMIDETCWDGTYEVAKIYISWIDMDPVKEEGRRALSPQARVVNISSQAPDGTCKPRARQPAQ